VTPEKQHRKRPVSHFLPPRQTFRHSSNCANIADTFLAMIRCRHKARPETVVPFKKLVEDPGETALGFCRKLNFAPCAYGASQ